MTPEAQGRAAFARGRPFHDNPFGPGRLEHFEWARGWLLARAERQQEHDPHGIGL